jgi:hypothetical protein
MSSDSVLGVFKQVFMTFEHLNEFYNKRTNGHFIETFF